MNTIKIISEAYSEAYWKFGVSIGKSEYQSTNLKHGIRLKNIPLKK